MDRNDASTSTMSVLPNFEGILGFEDIKSRFIQSARLIMLEHDLVRAEHRWQITALELYLFHPEVWPDDSTDLLLIVRNYLRSGRLAWRAAA